MVYLIYFAAKSVLVLNALGQIKVLNSCFFINLLIGNKLYSAMECQGLLSAEGICHC